MKFFVNLIDQLDFALDHIVLEDINYKRLSLMLVDNAMELALHQYATEQSADAWPLEAEPKIEPRVLAAALGQNFDEKLKLARLCGLVDEDMVASITTLHSYRNQLYHQGIKHEQVLPALVLFYFRITCDVLIAYQPTGYSWSSGGKVPHRALKYIGRESMRNPRQAFPAAWARLREVSESIPLDLTADLAARQTR
ncbi:MAG: hypothetical protein CMQ43_01540 [Gammaproteobacteria bacterium]|nr:hypothetical protein [Gammaproteobacteria bacterium]